MFLKLIAFSWQLLSSSPYPSPNISLIFDRVKLKDQGKPDGAFIAPYDSALVQLQIMTMHSRFSV